MAGLSGDDALNLAKAYVRKTIGGAGALKGSPCTIKSIVEVDGGNEVTFEWTSDDGTTQQQTMLVKDGKDGANGLDGENGKDGESPVVSVERNSENNGAIITIKNADGTETTAEVKDGEQGSSGASSWGEISDKPFEELDEETISSVDGKLKVVGEFGQDNLIESISVNGEEQKITGKNVNITVPEEYNDTEIKEELSNLETIVDNLIWEGTSEEYELQKDIIPTGTQVIITDDNVQMLDSKLSDTSTNAVQNRVVTEALNDVNEDIETLNTRTDGMLKPVLLWTNPDITAEFPAQTIELDLIEYDAVTFRFKSSWQTIHHEPITPIGGSGGAITFLNMDNVTMNIFLSNRSYHVTGTGVSFGDSTYRPLTSTTDTNFPATRNTDLIPYRIYGYKKTT